MPDNSAAPSMELRSDYSLKIHYNLPDYPVYMKKGILSQYPKNQTTLHWHDDIELVEALEGQMNYNIDGRVVNLREGDGIFINSRQTHFSYHGQSGDCTFLLLQIHPAFLESVPAVGRDFVQPILEKSALPWIYLDHRVIWQNRILHLMRDIYAQRNAEVWPLRTLAAFAEIWSILYEHMEISPERRREAADLTIARNMVGFIQQHYAEQITLGDIAAAGLVGQSKCCRLFAHYYQISPVRYLQEYRLGQSAWLLQNTEDSVTEIAMSCGFNDVSYFSNCFRKWAGMTPRSYRKRR